MASEEKGDSRASQNPADVRAQLDRIELTTPLRHPPQATEHPFQRVSGRSGSATRWLSLRQPGG